MGFSSLEKRQIHFCQCCDNITSWFWSGELICADASEVCKVHVMNLCDLQAKCEPPEWKEYFMQSRCVAAVQSGLAPLGHQHHLLTPSSARGLYVSFLAIHGYVVPHGEPNHLISPAPLPQRRCSACTHPSNNLQVVAALGKWVGVQGRKAWRSFSVQLCGLFLTFHVYRDSYSGTLDFGEAKSFI